MKDTNGCLALILNPFYFVLIYANKYCLTKSLLCVKISDQVKAMTPYYTLLNTFNLKRPLLSREQVFTGKRRWTICLSFLVCSCFSEQSAWNLFMFCSTGCLSECAALHCSLQTLVRECTACPALRLAGSRCFPECPFAPQQLADIFSQGAEMPLCSQLGLFSPANHYNFIQKGCPEVFTFYCHV